MDIDKLVVIDFETLNDSRKLGLSYYHPDFEVISCSFLVGGKKVFFSDDKKVIKGNLKYFWDNGYTFLGYTAFEPNIMRHHFKFANIYSRYVDVWRLFNYVCTTATDKYAKKDQRRDTKLPGAVKYLFKVKNYKMPYLQYFIDNKLAKTEKEAHAMVANLPKDLLERYNNEDVLWTWHVFTEAMRLLAEWDIPWEADHEAYLNECQHYGDSYVRGIRVDRELLKKNIEDLTKQLKDCSEAILTNPAIHETEKLVNKGKPVAITKKDVSDWKKQKGLDKTYVLSEDETNEVLDMKQKKKWIPFNLNSGPMKIVLFIEVLKYSIVRLTPKGDPKVDKKTLKSYGDLGGLFIKYSKIYKQLEECVKIEILSREDGRLHLNMRSGSTITSRSSSSN